MYVCRSLILLLVGWSTSVHLPPTFPKCNAKEKDLQQCFTKAVQAVISQLDKPFSEVGLPTLEPLEVPTLVIEAGKGVVGLTQNYKNVKLTGLTKVSVSSADYNPETKTITIKCVGPLLLTFEYNVNGKILLLPVRGNGPGSLDLTDLTVILTFTMEEYTKDNDKYFKIVGCTLSLDPKHITYDYQNLFDGDKLLGDNINKVLNDNWLEVFSDVRGGYEKAFSKVISSVIERMLQKVPVADLFGAD